MFCVNFLLLLYDTIFMVHWAMDGRYHGNPIHILVKHFVRMLLSVLQCPQRIGYWLEIETFGNCFMDSVFVFCVE